MFECSMFPGGAMMMHESVSEYDPNVAPPDTTSAIRQAFVENPDYDPVIALINKTRPIYDRICELDSINLEPESEREAVADHETIAATASRTIDALRCILVKQRAMSSFIISCYKDWVYEDFIANANTILKHKQGIISQGYDRFEGSCKVLDIGIDSVESMISGYIMTNPGLPEFPLSLDHLARLGCSAGTDTPRFLSVSDLFQCIYHDPDRMIRLERDEPWLFTIDEIFDTAVWANKCDYVGTSDITQLIQRMSIVLRTIMQTTYRYQCNIIDPQINVPIGEYHTDTRRMIAGLHDMLTLTMIGCLKSAYVMRKHISMRNSVKSYVTMLLDLIRERRL